MAKILALCLWTGVLLSAGAVAADDHDRLLDDLAALLAPPAATPAGPASPAPCATLPLLRAAAARQAMNPAQRARLDALLAPRPRAEKSGVLLSPAGRFRLTYETEGAHAVPSTDQSPVNGIPDYVENAAAYLDASWDVLIDAEGFTPPPTAGAPYEVGFVATDEFLGATYPLEGRFATRIELRSSMNGLSWSQAYPDVTPDDILRMVCAHELKHACQRAQSSWSEGDWVELDATWSQQVVFPAENDYRRYLSGASVGPSCLSHPHLPLDEREGVAGLYEEMLWQTWMSETWGVGFIDELWERREDRPEEPMLATYDALLATRGMDLRAGFGLFAAWNFLTAHRAADGVGYRDAARFPPVPLSATVALFPSTRGGALDHLSAVHVYGTGFPDDGFAELAFDGDADGAPVLTVAVLRRDGGAELHAVPLDGQGDAVFTVPTPLAEVERMGYVVANGSTDRDGAPWSLTVDVRTPPALTLSDAALDLGDVAAVATATLTLTAPADGPEVTWSAAAVADAAGPAWLAVTPASGSLAPGDAAVLNVTADPAGLAPGDHAGAVEVAWAAAAAPGLSGLRRIAVEIAVPAAGGLRLARLGPNPARGEVTVGWEGAKSGAAAEILVGDLRGRVLRRARTPDAAAVRSWTWDGRDDDGRPCPGGRYWIRVATPSGDAAGTVVLVR